MSTQKILNSETIITVNLYSENIKRLNKMFHKPQVKTIWKSKTICGYRNVGYLKLEQILFKVRIKMNNIHCI